MTTSRGMPAGSGDMVVNVVRFDMDRFRSSVPTRIGGVPGCLPRDFFPVL